MKKRASRLQKAAPLILLGMLLDGSPVTPSAKALVGGPFDEGRYPGISSTGTYSGTMTGKNLIGIVTFGVSDTLESSGRFSVFHEGFVHYGAATGVVDVDNRQVTGFLLGVAALGGSGVTANSNTVSDSVGSSGNLGQVNGLPQQIITVRGGAEGGFDARLKGYPNKFLFEGEGRLSTTANTAVATVPTANNPGFTVFFSQSGSPQTATDAGTENTTQSAAGGTVRVDASPQRAVLRTQTPFKVRGSRTSRTYFVPFNNYSSIPPVALVPQDGSTGN